VLSEFAGAAKQLDTALLVNPHDIEGMARQIATALSMSLEERRERWHAMVAKLRSSSIQDWFADFLRALNDTRRVPARLATLRPAAAAPVLLEMAGRSAQRH
jgi:trehalose 6-phosphate synthase